MRLARLFPLVLATTFAVVLAVSLGFTLRFRRFSDRSADLATSLQETVRLNRELQIGIARQVALVRQQFQAFDPLSAQQLLDLNDSLGRTETEYLKLRVDRDQRLAVERIKALRRDLAVQTTHVFELLRRKNRAAEAYLRASEESAARLAEELSTLNELHLSSLRGTLERLDAAATGAYRATFPLAGGLLLTLALFAWLLRRRVLGPLRALLGVSDRIRHGDLAARADVARTDELGDLARHVNEMAASLETSYATLEAKVEERTRQLETLQEQFVQSSKMSALGQLVSGVAHEVNNPLAAVMGFAELCRRRLANEGSADPRIVDMLDRIMEQSDRCRRIVGNLLQFARRQEPKLEAVRVNALIEDVLRLREYEISTRNSRLVRDYDPAEPVISADPHKLQQLVLNLLNNAHDAVQETGRGGVIWVTTRSDAERVSIEFKDTGTGLREPDKVFDPFYTTKPTGKGTGLGLSVCYGIVEEHRGRIRGENWAQGARFVVNLPWGRPVDASAEAATPAAAPALTSRRRALVVDDEPAVLEIQSCFLSDLGMETEVVESGERAIELLQSSPVDVVISDIRLKGSIDGLALYRWVRHHRPEMLKRFVFVSGDPEVLKDLDGEAPRLCIEKPFRFEVYAATVRRALGETA